MRRRTVLPNRIHRAAITNMERNPASLTWNFRSLFASICTPFARPCSQSDHPLVRDPGSSAPCEAPNCQIPH